jgi:Regulator of chromosome condensation (RCC1) repeat
LGNGGFTNSATPVRVSGLNNGVWALSAGSLFACAINAMDNVVCWGSNNYGELGNGTTTLSAVPVEVQALDASPPSSNPAIVAGTLGNLGYYRSDVVVNWNWSDYGVGIDDANCVRSSTSSGDGNPIVLTATCRDRAGNLGLATFSVRVDRTGPIAAPSVSAGWYRADAMVNWNWSDATSGVDALNCTFGSTSVGEGAAITMSATCKDFAGNTSAASVTVKVDKTAPTLNPTVNPNPVLQYLATVATPNASDALSGLASSSCNVPSTATAGINTVSCTATDVAGNVSIRQATYAVDSADTALTKLISQVNALGLDKNTTKSLVSQLQNAQSNLARNKKAAAIDRLSAFVAQVNSLRGTKIATAAADALVAYASLIIASIQASP